MIQTYAYILDLHPSEPAIPEELKKVKESIREKGILNQLNVEGDGRVIRGNTRYHAALELFMEGDTRFAFVPIRSDLVVGELYFPMKPQLAPGLVRWVRYNIRQKRPLHPTKRRIEDE